MTRPLPAALTSKLSIILPTHIAAQLSALAATQKVGVGSVIETLVAHHYAIMTGAKS